MNKIKAQAILKNLRIPLRIGIDDSERGIKQLISISAKVNFFVQSHLSKAAIQDVYNYATLHDYFVSWENKEHTDMIETLLWEAFCFIFSDTTVIDAEISLLKLAIFDDTQEAGIEIFMTKEQWLEQKN